MGELDGKVAVITGAGSGMAKASVKIFMREGAAGVVAADISGAQEDTAKEVGGNVVPVRCDVTKEDEVIAMIDTAVEQFGRVDAILNVAGIATGKPMLSYGMDEFDKLMDILVKGVWFGTTHGIRAMQKCGNGGSIVNWSSLAGLNGSPYTAVYSTAKAGVIAITKAAAIEHGAENIRCNAIAPGFILSEGMGAGLAQMEEGLKPKVPMNRIGAPSEVAELGAFLASDRASYINGSIITVDGGYGCRFG
jgi:NAD(P)-dependent dehydrogenase (short-subunit alcohol dehydrogenase family)